MKALALSLLCLTTIAAPAAAATPSQQPLSIFRSRAAIKRALGARTANAIPRYFNFKRYALVRVHREVSDKARVKLHDVRKLPYFFTLSPAQRLTIENRGKILAFVVTPDNFCHGGAPKPLKMQAQCNKHFSAQVAAAAGTIHFFAIKRRLARKVQWRQGKMQHRPAARVR